MENYNKEENEEIVAEFTITKEGMECFTAGVLTTLLLLMVAWGIRTYLQLNWGV